MFKHNGFFEFAKVGNAVYKYRKVAKYDAFQPLHKELVRFIKSTALFSFVPRTIPRDSDTQIKGEGLVS